MKRFFIFIALVVSFLNYVNGQDTLTNTLQFTGATVSAGKGAVTSGLYLFSDFENKKANLTFTFSNDDIEISYLYKIAEGKVLIGPNAGFFYNVPYVSAQAFTNLVPYFSTMHWWGYSFGKPEMAIQAKPTFLFLVNQGSIVIKNFRVSYTLINYLDNEPIHTLTGVYTQKLNQNFSVFTEVGWDFTAKNQLLLAGIKFTK